MTAKIINAFRAKFPLLNKTVNNLPIVYFDNAATTQKPQDVIDSYHNFYQTKNSNVHRASHALSSLATAEFEQARLATQHFISAKYLEEIIWTKGTTESINLIAQSWGRDNLVEGDEILLSQGEHHANIVPWQIIAEATGAIIKTLPICKSGYIDCQTIDSVINERTKVVSLALISNVLGRLNRVKKLIESAKHVGAITVIDAAQAIVHIPIDVQQLDCDFLVFSAHKMYGPSGVGVLYGKRSLLEGMPPYQAGGEMIKNVSFNQATTFNQLPFKFEAGTPNIAGVIAFLRTIEFLNRQNLSEFHQYEKYLTAYCYQKLSQIESLSFIAQGCPDIPLFSFTIEGHHNHDIASALDSFGIAVRSGHHCAMPLMEYLGINGCLRVSLAHYNIVEEIDYLVSTLKEIIAQQVSDNLKTENKHFDTSFEASITTFEHDLSDSEVSYLTVEEIKQLFKRCDSWDARHREIMLLGKSMTRMMKDKRTATNLISGCESSAWLTVANNRQGKYYFQADSDAKVIRGLLSIILAAFNGKSAYDIKNFDLESYITQLGLMQHLSPSRGNGLQAIIKQCYQLVN